MDRNQALSILTSLTKTSKLTEDERNACYQALQLLSKLSSEDKRQNGTNSNEHTG